MKSKNEFYVGWQNSMQAGTRSLLVKYLFFIFISSAILISIYVINQREFTNSRYELGNITEHEGYIFLDPKPVLVIVDEQGIRRSLLLVSYGKFGAEDDLISWKSLQESNVFGSYVSIKGTVATYDGETVLELTSKEKSITIVSGKDRLSRQKQSLGKTSLPGEIVDPKCFFGAMKPGDGKIHKSCAIRCLSGGIPPVLVDESDEYYTLVFPDDFDISSIYNVVAKPVTIEGELIVIDGKSYLYVDDDTSITLSNLPLLDVDLTTCMLH